MYIIPIVVNIVLIVFDQFTKYLALTKLKPINSISIINGIFELSYVENRGAAFGIMQDFRWFFILLTIPILIVIIIYYLKLPKGKPYNWMRISLVLIFAGATGNFIDRFMNGYVIDFFYARFINFPVFNMADIYVVIGTILLAFLLLFVIKDEHPKTEPVPDSEMTENED